MNKNIVLATLLAAVAFYPLSATSSHAATCADELKVVESKYNSSKEGEVRDHRGAETKIASAQSALVSNDDAKCMQQVAEARSRLRTNRESSDNDGSDD